MKTCGHDFLSPKSFASTFVQSSLSKVDLAKPLLQCLQEAVLFVRLKRIPCLEIGTQGFLEMRIDEK